MPGKKNVVVDTLSRWPSIAKDIEEAEREEDIDNWIKARMLVVRESLRLIKWENRPYDIVRVRLVVARS